jgi:hypothetical protein
MSLLSTRPRNLKSRLSGELTMFHVLKLQAIAPALPVSGGIDLLFSSASGICPTQNDLDEKGNAFEME